MKLESTPQCYGLAAKWRAGLLLCALVTVQARAGTYYVDSANGNDGNNGTTTNTAWQSLGKVNGRTFVPGDSVLFKAGGYWAGQLNPKGSGATNNPIVIDMYGGAARPVIDANGATGGGVVYLFNQEFWEINNLELMDDAAGADDRRGIYLSASNFVGAVVDHLYVRNCYIHNIKGFAVNDADVNQVKRTGGIIVETISDSKKPTRFNDVLIENCQISTADGTGIALNNKISVSDYPGTTAWDARKFTQVVIRGNAINDIGKNAMIIRLTDETGLVEHNVCYDTAYRSGNGGNTIFSRSSRGTVFQYNEGYLNRADTSSNGGDGSLYDADSQSPGCIFQYSYSHDNNHGLYWQCTEPEDGNVIVRYNISQNDRGSIFCMNYDCTSAFVYNNTVYVRAGLSPRIVDERPTSAFTNKTYYFYNNIIYNASSTATYQWYNKNVGGRTFDYNVFYGQHPSGEPSDGHKLTSDPKLVAPGTGGTNDWGSLAGYKLQPSSPCIGSGMTLTNNGGQDLWGNLVPSGSSPDRGANQWTPAVPGITNQPPVITPTNVTLRALLNPNGAATAWYHQYGPTTNYGGFTATNSLPTGTAGVAVSNGVSGLFPGALYHYRMVASNSTGESSSPDATFTTLAVAPPQLTGPGILGDGSFQFTFANPAGVSFSVLAATNLGLPASNWSLLQPPIPIGSGVYQVTDANATNSPQRFYRLRQP